MLHLPPTHASPPLPIYRASFASGVAALATSQEMRKSDFQYYIDWYDRHGPYDIMIDGANVAYFGQNRESGGFCWRQIMQVMRLVQREHPGKKVMLVRGVSRGSPGLRWCMMMPVCGLFWHWWRWRQIMQVMRLVQGEHPGKKVMLVRGVSRGSLDP
jgi:hypothetical protein